MNLHGLHNLAVNSFNKGDLMKALTLHSLQNIHHLTSPCRKNPVSLLSNSLRIMGDFNNRKPLILESTLSAVDAKKLMEKVHVQLKIIVSEDDEFLGLLALGDLSEQAFVTRVRSGQARDELTIDDFMIKRHKLEAFEITELEESTIMDVLTALKDSADKYCLVQEAGLDSVRGIISAIDIARNTELGLPVDEILCFKNLYKRALKALPHYISSV